MLYIIILFLNELVCVELFIGSFQVSGELAYCCLSYCGCVGVVSILPGLKYL